MFVDCMRTYTAEHTIAVLGDLSKAAVYLPVPVRKACPVCKVFRLIKKTGAQAAGIHFLQTYQVIRLDQVGDAVQVRYSLLQGQQVLPALGDILMEILCINTRLNVETEQAQHIATLQGDRVRGCY
jgi:hypothetical protein